MLLKIRVFFSLFYLDLLDLREFGRDLVELILLNRIFLRLLNFESMNILKVKVYHLDLLMLVGVFVSIFSFLDRGPDDIVTRDVAHIEFVTDGLS